MCAGGLHACPVVPRLQAVLELYAMARRVHPVPGQCEVLADRTKPRKKRLRRDLTKIRSNCYHKPESYEATDLYALME